MNKKYEDLKEYLKKQGKLAIAYSSGVDSAFLLNTALEVLGSKVMAITVAAPFFPQSELEEARQFCLEKGIKHIVIEKDMETIEGFAANPQDRCYICKKSVFSDIREAAARFGFSVVAEGTNIDDEGDYRPGMKAIKELGIVSPLKEAGFTKAEIRKMSSMQGLGTWDKPSFACLASRFPYGEEITAQKLKMVEDAEAFLHEQGFRQVRVRVHGNVARIETLSEDIDRMLDEEMRAKVMTELKKCGFAYVALDLGGYRTGSLNEAIGRKSHENR